MALDEAIHILEIITPIAETLPVVGTPLKGALEVLGKILGFAKVRYFDARDVLISPSSWLLGSKGEQGAGGRAGRASGALATDSCECAQRSESAALECASGGVAVAR
jgi:hypothetical protein